MVDNQATIHLGTKPVNFPLAKHINVKFHLVREQVADKTVSLVFVRTTDQLADVLTKALSGPMHNTATARLRLLPFSRI
jgi:hypothetical protein